MVLPSQAVADRAQARSLATEGQEFADQGLQAKALERYEKSILSDPDYHRSYQLALPLWLKLGHWRSAQQELESLTIRCEDCSFAWYGLAVLYRKQGRFDWAILAYDTYISQRPTEPDAYFGLAISLHQEQDPRLAATLRRYLSLESRVERTNYRKQAQRMLSKIAPEMEVSQQSELEQAADYSFRPLRKLVEAGQLFSASTLLQQRGLTGHRAIALRAQIAGKRGQWFQEALYRSLLWLWRQRR